MNGYIVTLKTPKKRTGHYVNRGIILAETMEEGLRLAKEQFGREMPGDTWNIAALEEKTLYKM